MQSKEVVARIYENHKTQWTNNDNDTRSRDEMNVAFAYDLAMETNYQYMKELKLCICAFNLMLNDPAVPSDHKAWIKLRVQQANELLLGKESEAMSA